jgi:hypothetical protein
VAFWDFVWERLKNTSSVALLIAVVILVLAVGGYLLTTPICESRSFALGIEIDRTHLPRCAEPAYERDQLPKAAPASAAPSPQPTLPNAPAIAAAPAPPDSSPASSNGRPEITFANNGVQELRATHRLSIVQADEDVLASTPTGTFGFVYSGSFATVWKQSMGELTVRNTARDIYFEIQKREDGQVYIVGFMRGDVARQLNYGIPPMVNFKIYNKRYRTTDAIVAVPVANIVALGQSEINFGENKVIPVLDLTLRGDK